MKVVLKQLDGNVLKLNECADASEKHSLKPQHLNNEHLRRENLNSEQIRRELINDEVLLRLLKENNFQNDREMKRKFEDFLLSSV